MDKKQSQAPNGKRKRKALDQPQSLDSAQSEDKPSLTKKKRQSIMNTQYNRIQIKDIINQDWEKTKLDYTLLLLSVELQSLHDLGTIAKASELIEISFSAKMKNEFLAMHRHHLKMQTVQIDSLNLEYKPFSDYYYLDRLIQKNNNKKVDFDSFLNVYLFQMYLNSGLELFKDIILMFKQIYNQLSAECQQSQVNQQNIIGINTMLNPQYGFKNIQLSINMQKIYNDLYPIMNSTFNFFNENNRKLQIII